MCSISKLLKSWGRDEDGTTAVEYAVLLALIVTACISVVGMLGSTVNSTFERTSASLAAPAAAVPTPAGASRNSGTAAAAPAAASSAP